MEDPRFEGLVSFLEVHHEALLSLRAQVTLLKHADAPDIATERLDIVQRYVDTMEQGVHMQLTLARMPLDEADE
ncbi:MAG: hypothetical protein F4Z31_16515 [Gemmatimonadetes bacterium]|nr:hypothetical protein [Gemmatimonadota bacterium]MYE94096.1 hypothetical protein [Gemmatimonadota bacterium]MYJ10908.1 hypothetical protein [Gemmatimonadota bacterium]